MNKKLTLKALLETADIVRPKRYCNPVIDRDLEKNADQFGPCFYRKRVRAKLFQTTPEIKHHREIFIESLKEVASIMSRKGYRPATLSELIIFIAQEGLHTLGDEKLWDLDPIIIASGSIYPINESFGSPYFYAEKYTLGSSIDRDKSYHASPHFGIKKAYDIKDAGYIMAFSHKSPPSFLGVKK